MKKNEKSNSIRQIPHPFPGKLERDFRRAIGQHNLHLNLLEIGVREFQQILSAQPNEQDYLRQKAKKNHFHSVFPHVSFNGSHRYLYVMHIAYAMSAGDALCEKIRDHPIIKPLKNKHISIFEETNKGNFLRKTTNLVTMASLDNECRSIKNIQNKVDKILAIHCFSIVNYYILLRNEELHALESLSSADAFEKLQINEIHKLYRLKPNKANLLNSEDALLCSKAWQDAAKWLCRHMFHDHDVSHPLLCNKYGNLAKDRRKKAAENFMKQELLYTNEECTVMLAKLGW